MNDQRIKFTNEVVEGIRLIKMYAWENAFQKICNSYRELEHKFISSQFYLYMVDRSISKSLGLITFLITIVFVHFFSDKVITLAEIFPTIQLLLVIKDNVLWLGIGISYIFEL